MHKLIESWGKVALTSQSLKILSFVKHLKRNLRIMKSDHTKKIGIRIYSSVSTCNN